MRYLRAKQTDIANYSGRLHPKSQFGQLRRCHRLEILDGIGTYRSLFCLVTPSVQASFITSDPGVKNFGRTTARSIWCAM